MSRIGRAPIELLAGVTFENNNGLVTVKGSLGTLTLQINPKITTRVENDTIFVENNNSEKEYRAQHGLYRKLIANMVEGVSKGFTKKLNVTGVGYKIVQSGSDLVLHIGFSHTVKVSATPGVSLSFEKNVISVKGIDKEAVGQLAAKIRAIKPVEPYHGYGISYTDEVVVRKEVKSGKKK